MWVMRTPKKPLRKSGEQELGNSWHTTGRQPASCQTLLRLAVVDRMRFSSLMILAMFAYSSGCGSPNGQAAPANDIQLRILGRLYGQYMAEQHGKPPADEAQLLAYLEKSADFLESQGIATPSELLKSPRDGQPLTILYGKQIIPDANTGFPWIAYESQGLDSKKYIIGARGNVDEMTQEQIEAMAPH